MWEGIVRRARIYAPERFKSMAGKVRECLVRMGVEVVEDGTPDLIIVVGGDREVLMAHQEFGDLQIPILGVGTSGTVSFLTTSNIESLEEDIKLILRGRYTLSEYVRLRGVVDKRRIVYCLNEIAVFPRRSAILMDYELNINGHLFWRDRADGVIVSTPTGSTAYALSAGGPIVIEGSEVFLVVPVNSLDPSRRPLVVPSSSKVRIMLVASSCPVEVIVDGQKRLKVAREVLVEKAPTPAYIVRLSRSILTSDSMRKKLKQAEELIDMPPSAKYILKILELEGPLTVKEIARLTLLPQRTVRYALSILLDKGLVKRKVNLRDARQAVYEVVKV